jgi:hypothetical protein
MTRRLSALRISVRLTSPSPTDAEKPLKRGAFHFFKKVLDRGFPSWYNNNTERKCV